MLQVIIPPNTTAEVYIPASEGDAITESGKTLKGQELAVSRYEKGYAVIDVPSGSYTFKRN